MNNCIKKIALLTFSSLVLGTTIHSMEMEKEPNLLASIVPDIKTLIAAAVLEPCLCYDWTPISLKSPNAVLNNSISKTVVSLDGSTAVAIINGEVNRINPHNGFIEKKSFAKNVERVALSANGKIALLVDTSNTVQFWDMVENKPLGKSFKEDKEVRAVVLSSNGETAILGLSEGGYRVKGYIKIVTVNGEEPEIFALPASIDSMAISANNEFVIAGLDSQSVCLFNLCTKRFSQLSTEKVEAKGARVGTIGCVAFSPKGDFAFAGYLTNYIVVWDTKTGELINSFEDEGNGTDGIVSLECSADGYSVLAVSQGRTLRLFDILEGTCLKELLLDPNNRIPLARFSPNGDKIVALTEDGTVFAWELSMKDSSWKTMRTKTAKALYEKYRLLYLFFSEENQG